MDEEKKVLENAEALSDEALDDVAGGSSSKSERLKNAMLKKLKNRQHSDSNDTSSGASSGTSESTGTTESSDSVARIAPTVPFI